MPTYEKPKEINEQTFNELSEKAKEILLNRVLEKFFTVFLTVALVMGIILLIAYSFTLSTLTFGTTNWFIAFISIFVFSIFLSIFASTLLIQHVLIFIRRFSAHFLKRPTPEEYIFARCAIIACRINEKRLYDENWWAEFLTVKPHGAIYQIGYLLEDFSLFSKDRFNVKRKFYAPEFKLLSGGKNQLERMIVFSSAEASKLFLDFGFALVNGEDSEVHKQLNKIIKTSEKFGKLENRFQRLSNQLTGLEGLITGIISLISSIIALALVFFK